jgi:hypothetical protein
MLTTFQFRNFVTCLGALGLVVSVASVGACSSESDNPVATPAEAGGGGNGEGGGGGDGGGGGGGGGKDAGVDAAPVVLNDCKAFKDLSGAADTRTIPWTIPLVAPERCMTIKKGQTVTWNGDFGPHPLVVKGGDLPSPIADVDPAVKTATFDTAGLFGYECSNHPSMIGAINVTE